MLALPIALLAFHAPLVRPPTSSLLRMEAPPPPATDDAAEEAPTRTALTYADIVALAESAPLVVDQSIK